MRSSAATRTRIPPAATPPRGSAGLAHDDIVGKKSQSSPGGSGFNEILFEDLAGRELVYVQAEKDLRKLVKNDQHLTVMGVKRELVDKERHLLVKGDRNEQVGGTYGLTAGSHHIACGAQAVGAGGTTYLKAGAEIVVEAPDITLKAPGGLIRLDGSGVTIQGSLVMINCGDSPPDFQSGGGGNPEKPTEAKVTRPPDPQVDDVSKTGLGPGR